MIILATISTNTAANIVSPTNVFQNVAPRYINENKGVILTGLIGIALMSYNGKLCWGFNADYDLVPDLEDFLTDVRDSFAELQELALREQRRKSRPTPAADAPGKDAPKARL